MSRSFAAGLRISISCLASDSSSLISATSFKIGNGGGCGFQGLFPGDAIPG